jgi:hypothetical protein
MPSSTYLTNRKKYVRPQAIIWCAEYGFSGTTYVPLGQEFDDFIILSDHNRKDIQIQQERIESRKRMINGTMRSYHVADKAKYSWSWDMLPSRGYDSAPEFDPVTGGMFRTVEPPNTVLGVQTKPLMYTADGGAGGSDLLKWYEQFQRPFFMLMAYDKDPYSNLLAYTSVVHVYFSSFKYDVVKRGFNSHDFWNVSVDLEEV